MKSFSQLVLEQTAPKTRVVLFGRMNPPTKGHEENVMNAHKVAEKHNADLNIIASHSHDDKKNPLSSEQKKIHLQRAFGHLPHTTIGTSSAESPSILHQAVAAHNAGVKHFIMAGGGDRAASYHKLLKQYNGVAGKAHGYYKFDKISVVDTGARREGISGTEMRHHAQMNDYDKFKSNLPSHIQKNEAHAKELFKHVQGGLAKKEDFSRDDYIQGAALPLGSIVEDVQTGMIGKIVYRGPTYVTVQVDEELSFKRWINDVDALSLPEMPDTLTHTFKKYVGEKYKGSADMEGFKQHVNEKADSTDFEVSEKDLKDIEKQIDSLTWDDISHLLEDTEQNDYLLDEDLTAAQRMHKKMEFMKSKAKREIALRVALKRPSGQGKLKKKAIVHARNMIKARLLKGRDYSKLSAAEKNRIENILKKSHAAVARISNRLVPKIRELETQRLKRVHEAAVSQIDGVENSATKTVADVASHLAGSPRPDLGNSEPDPKAHIKRLRHFRKLEV